MESYKEELYHHGILGMKWGVRRYQNKDGSLTPLGRKHLGYSDAAKKKVASGGKFDSKTVEKQMKFQSNIESNWYKSYNKATDEMNQKLNAINKKV